VTDAAPREPAASCSRASAPRKSERSGNDRRSGALAQSRIIYLSHNGVTLHPGNNDARTNTSSIVSANVAIPAWSTTPQVWADTVTCFKDIFSRFDVQVTDVDSGNVPHILAVFGGTPQQVGLPSNVGAYRHSRRRATSSRTRWCSRSAACAEYRTPQLRDHAPRSRAQLRPRSRAARADPNDVPPI